jgi:acyl-CoA reductase-like NAD-dependent aldehyde dehydrogenase
MPSIFSALLAYWIEALKAQGAKVEYGGERNEDDCFISPTIFSNIPMPECFDQEEIFGPIMPTISYDKLDDALRFGRFHGEAALALVSFSSSEKNIRNISSAILRQEELVSMTTSSISYSPTCLLVG